MANDEMKTIEHDLEETRARTERTIEQLQERLQPRAVLDETTRFFRGTDSGEYAEDMTRNAIAQARENPLPLALIGAGAALLAAKRPGRRRYVYEDAYAGGEAGYAGTYAGGIGTEDWERDQEALDALYDTEWEETHRVVGAADTIDETTVRNQNETEDAYHERLYAARARALKMDRESGEEDHSFRKRIDERLSRARNKAKEYGAKAAEYRKRQSERASRFGHEAGSRASSAYGATRARAERTYEGTRRRAGDLAHGTQEQASRLAHGTQEQASRFAHGTQDAARSTVRRTANFYEDNPLAAAAIAVAAGAIGAAFFSSTRPERRALGQVGDEVNEAAQRLNEEANRRVQEYAERTEEAADKVSKNAEQFERGEKGPAAASKEGSQSGYTPSSQPTASKPS